MWSIFFKKLTVFEHPLVGFTIVFPEKKWKFRRIKKNTFLFLKIATRNALILEVGNNRVYTEDSLEEEMSGNFTKTTIGDFAAYVLCKRFEKHPVLQYEWKFIDSGSKITFTYCIESGLEEKKLDELYEEVVQVLNTIKSR
jgi:hypothetical protein